MKICFVINEFNFFKTHRLDLCISLSQLHEITIVTDAVNASGEDLNMLSPYQIKIIHLNQRSGSLNFYSYFNAVIVVIFDTALAGKYEANADIIIEKTKIVVIELILISLGILSKK